MSPTQSSAQDPGLDRQRPAREPVDRRAVRGRDPGRRGPRRRRGSARRPDRPPHRPLARGQVHRPRAIERGKIGWGAVNRPISEEHYERLRARLLAYTGRRPIYAQDLFIGAAPEHRRSLRVYTETAWASIFARNLFRRPSAAELATFAPNFTIINVPSFKADPATEGTRTETAILLHLKRMEILIVGTEYAGEIKKGAFTVMNYLLPDEGILPMHSAINVGKAGDPAIFFGLSGTGKTTLSADPERSLIGDDEHGWGDGRRLQLRGRLLRQDDPPLADLRARHLLRPPAASGRSWRTSTSIRPPASSNLDSDRFTENTRGAYPLEFIGNADPTGIAGQPRTVILLTADAFGVLPPIARLTHDQAAYHFLSAAIPPSWRDRDRGQGAQGHLLDLLRGAVHAPPAGRVRRACSSSAWRAGMCRSGWSTPAGPAARTGRASG